MLYFRSEWHARCVLPQCGPSNETYPGPPYHASLVQNTDVETDGMSRWPGLHAQ